MAGGAIITRDGSLRMPGYLIGHIEVTDPEKFEQYRPMAAASIEKYGGTYVVRGGEVETLEGELPAPRLVILRFESLDQLHRWYNSPEYQEAKAIRQAAARSVFAITEGL